MTIESVTNPTATDQRTGVGTVGGLAALGIERGDHVAILAGTRPEWTLADLGALDADAQGQAARDPPALRGPHRAALPVVNTLDDTETAVALRDGSSVVVRPVRPADRELLLAGFERLGPESRYRRFLAPMAELTDDIVTYLTDVDHHDHEALAAIDAATGEGVAVARFVRDADRPDTAEFAITVIDDWRGRGVGTVLLDLLAERAREEGVVRFSALLLAENREMLELLEAIGPVRVVDRQSGTVEVEADLAPTGAGADLHGVLGASARGPVRLAVRPLAPGRADRA